MDAQILREELEKQLQELQHQVSSLVTDTSRCIEEVCTGDCTAQSICSYECK